MKYKKSDLFHKPTHINIQNVALNAFDQFQTLQKLLVPHQRSICARGQLRSQTSSLLSQRQFVFTLIGQYSVPFLETNEDASVK